MFGSSVTPCFQWFPDLLIRFYVIKEHWARQAVDAGKYACSRISACLGVWSSLRNASTSKGKDRMNAAMLSSQNLGIPSKNANVQAKQQECLSREKRLYSGQVSSLLCHWELRHPFWSFAGLTGAPAARGWRGDDAGCVQTSGDFRDSRGLESGGLFVMFFFCKLLQHATGTL